MDDLSPGQTDVFEILDLVSKEGLKPIPRGHLVPEHVIRYEFLTCACTEAGHLFCTFLQFPEAKRRCKLTSA